MIEEIIRYVALGFVGFCIVLIYYYIAEMLTKKKWLKWLLTGLFIISSIGIYYIVEGKPLW